MPWADPINYGCGQAPSSAAIGHKQKQTESTDRTLAQRSTRTFEQ